MNPKFIGVLGSIQAMLVIIKIILWPFGVYVPWTVTLIPLWILLFIAIVFWTIFATLWSKLGG